MDMRQRGARREFHFPSLTTSNELSVSISDPKKFSHLVKEGVRMATDEEDSSSTLEKLILIVFIAAIVLGNVTCPSMRDSRLILLDLDLRLCHILGTVSSQALVEYQRLGDGIDRFIYRWLCPSDALSQ